MKGDGVCESGNYVLSTWAGFPIPSPNVQVYLPLKRRDKLMLSKSVEDRLSPSWSCLPTIIRRIQKALKKGSTLERTIQLSESRSFGNKYARASGPAPYVQAPPQYLTGAEAGMTPAALGTKTPQGFFCLHFGYWSFSNLFPTPARHFLLLLPGPA